MRKLVKAVTVAVASVAMAASATGGRLSSAAATCTETVMVKGRGVGADKAEALKDAFRDAVEHAVGLYVDAEQMVKNEELVKDQILTQSNAYIEKCDVVEENTKPNGLVEIQILAEVRKTALTKKISDVMPTKTFRLGGELKNVHAKMTTTAKRNVDGAALLKKALDGFDPLALVAECELASTESVVREMTHPRDPKDKIAVNYLFRVGINQKRYSESVVPRLKNVLSQISLSEPCTVTVPIRMNTPVDVDAKIAEGHRSPYRLESQYGVNSSAGQPPSVLEKEMLDKPKSEAAAGFLILVTGVNKYRTSFSGIRYELDGESQKIVNSWAPGQLSPKFISTITDAVGDVIATRRVEPYATRSWCVLHWSTDAWRSRDARWMNVTMVAPFGGSQNSFVLDDFAWHEFVIPKDALPEVRDMKIEIAK